MVCGGLFINVARRRTCMDQVGVNGAKHEEKWGPKSVLKHETERVNGDITVVTVTDCRYGPRTGGGSSRHTITRILLVYLHYLLSA